MIQYIKDEKMLHKDAIIKGLIDYNKSKTGELEKGSHCVYVIENDEPIGAMMTSYGWNWGEIGDYYYRDESVLKVLLNEVHKYYQNKVEAICLPTRIGSVSDTFEAYGYVVPGRIKDLPKGYDFTEMMNNEMAFIEDVSTYKIQTSTEEIEYWHTLLKARDLFVSFDVEDDAEELVYAALDGEELIGGVYGHTSKGYLYVSILWVDETFRNQDVGSALMDRIEEDAIEQGIKNFWLGTSSFQAKGFYEKRGYESVIHFSNCPKGFSNDTMVKYG